MNPLVTISCITYNHENYIRKAIEGFLMQKTTFPIEILIHDDASIDGTSDIIREYEKQYPDLIFPIYQTENQYSKGVKISLTYQFPRARGKYIALCEGVDYWTDPLKLKKQVDFLESHEQYSACFTNATILNEINNTSSPYITFLNEGNVSLEKVIEMGGYIYPTASLLFKRENIQSDIFRELLENLAGDTSLILVSAMQGKIFFLDQPACVYRRWTGGMYSSISKETQSKVDWKAQRLEGYKKLQEMVDNSTKKFVRKKISSESLFILRNSKKLSRFLYLGNLTEPDFKALLSHYANNIKQTLKLRRL